jgi:hypothetical protein
VLPRRVYTLIMIEHGTRRVHLQLTPAQDDSQPPEPINLADHQIRQKQILGRLTCEYYIAALPPCVATENAGHHPDHISGPHRVPADVLSEVRGGDGTAHAAAAPRDRDPAPARTSRPLPRP